MLDSGLAAQQNPTSPRAKRVVSERASRRAFFGCAALFFVAGVTATLVWFTSMSTGETEMPGGWTMSMVWMRMPGQTWPIAAGSFLGMWGAMMVPMMLPSLAPVLWRYRQGVALTDATRLFQLTALMSLGYFFVWAVLGMTVFAVGVALATLELKLPALARAVPITTGVVVVFAGALQVTHWKARQLACCRRPSMCGRVFPASAGMAWREGLRLGSRCCACCAGLTAAFLVAGVMNLGAMAAVTAAISLERLTPAGERIGRVIGALILGAGLFLIARAS